MSTRKRAWVVATLDTKLDEAEYVCGLLEAAGLPVTLADLSTESPVDSRTTHLTSGRKHISAAEIAAHHPLGESAVFCGPAPSHFADNPVPAPPPTMGWRSRTGIDLIVIYNSGRYRMAGRGSLSGLLAYGNANDVVMEMAKEVLPVVCATSTICLRIIPASRKVSSRATAPATRSDAYEF